MPKSSRRSVQAKRAFMRRLRGKRFGLPKKRYKKKLALKSHAFVERVEDTITLNSNTLDANGNLGTCYSKEFKLDDIAQVAQYKELFDDYVLNKVVMELRYDTFYSGSTTADVPINPIYPQLLIKTDHNDAATSETWTTMKESERSRLVQMRPSMNKPVSHVIKPACQVELYKTALGSAYGPKWGQVIRTIDSAVPHYGVKIQVQTQPSNSAIVLGKITIMYKYYFTMKNPE